MKQLVDKVSQRIKSDFEGEGTGHDWWHIHRVVTNALKIQATEGGDKELITLAALLHDVGDHKFHKAKDAQQVMVTQILEDCQADPSTISKILSIISEVSFKGNKKFKEVSSLEAKVVQDADRLDALGAVGIARAFAYGGNKNRLLYHPDESPKDFKTAEEYTNDKGHTINHFYEKLLLLKDLMQTETGKKMAQNRHQYMEGFLSQFYAEWNGKENQIS